MKTEVLDVVRLLREGRRTVALTGAGMSVASGIPDFRSTGGIWERYDPAEYATMSAFLARPGKVWGFFRELREMCVGTEPNPGHEALAQLEREGPLQAVLTQNVDGLHERAGSTVVALHGRGDQTRCPECGATGSWPPDGEAVPRCSECGAATKVDAILFEEMLQPEIIGRAREYAATCELMLVVGTSAQVYPVAELPRIALDAGARLIEINVETTPLAGVSLRLQGRAEELLPELVARALS
jgi:NAD-dependent deacetylase